jgi:serine/threonine protein kinase
MRLVVHKNVLPLLDTFSRGRRLYIVTELCNMGTLSDVLKKKPRLEEKVAVVIMNQMLQVGCRGRPSRGVWKAPPLITLPTPPPQGIEHIHNLGWVHQDIKAANLLFRKGGIVKLCDFGVARDATLTTLDAASAEESSDGGALGWRAWFQVRRSSKPSRPSTLLAGTPFYMAPEVVAQKGDPSPAADMWSAGIVWVQMVTGTLPYSNLHPLKAMVVIAQSEPPSLTKAGVSLKAVEVAHVCLQRDAKAV